MPSASPELRKEWRGPGEQYAMRFLRGLGYSLTRTWQWRLPRRHHRPTEREIRAMWFLVEEWDMGGFGKWVHGGQVLEDW